MGKDLVERLEYELDKAALGRAVGRLLRELARLGVEVDVAPQPSIEKLSIQFLVPNTSVCRKKYLTVYEYGLLP